MTMAYKIRPDQQERLAAVTHLDGTGRLQTVEKDVNPIYWNLINEFGIGDERTVAMLKALHSISL